MKKKLLLKHFLLLFAIVAGSTSVWAEEPELTLDFTSAWTAVEDNSDGEKVFTTTVDETTYTISGKGNTNFKFNSGYFFFGKSGAYVNLPIVDFDVKKIEVVGRSGASGDVKHNIFVGDEAVSTEVKGLNGTTSTFVIASDYQAAGTQYTLMVTSSHNAQVTYIKYYKKTSGGDEPTTYTITFDSGDGTFVGNTDFPNASNTKEAGTYTLPSATPASGYTFDGWVTTDNETPQTGSYTVSGDVDFTAHYTQNSSDPNPTYTYNFAGANNFYTDADLSTHPSYGNSNNVSTIYYGDGSVFVASGTSRYFSAASSGYFMLGKSGAKIDLPKFEGYKIKQVTLHSSTGHSTSVAVSIVSGSNTASAAQTWSTKDKDYVYDIASDYQSSALSVKVTNAYNTQFTSITIVCEEDVPSTDPQIVVNSTTVNLAYDATSGEIPFTIVNPVPGTAIGAGVFDTPWISNVDYENVSGNDYKVIFNATANTNPEARSATITITYGTLTKDVTVTQAAYVAPADGYYVKVTSTDDITDGQYLIVYEEGSVAFDGGLTTLDAVGNTIEVVIDDDEIAATTDTRAAEFTIDVTAGTLESASGLYIGVSSNSNGLKQNESADAYSNTFSIDNGSAVIKADFSESIMYLNYNSDSGQTRFRYYKNASQKTIQLYKYIPEYETVETAHEYITFCSTKALDFSQVEGLDAYIVTKVNTSSVSTTKVETAVPAGIGLVLKKTGSASSFEVPVVAEATAPEGNLLTGVTKPTLIGDLTNATDYILYDGTFYPASQGTLPAGKAYLRVMNGNAPELGLDFSGETTGIVNVNRETITNNQYYTLDGRRVENPTNGIYIINGHKVVIK